MLKEKILEHFIKNNETYTLAQLAEFFGVSRNACWKAINKLKEEGFEFENDKTNGYSYINSGKLSCAEINLISKHFKCSKVFDLIDSTSTYLKNNTKANNLEVVVANEQVQGRGRRGKTFVSKKGLGAYFTLYMQQRIDFEDINYVTICGAVAIRRCLYDIYNISADIKWLNDIYYKNKKLSGILTEAVMSAEEACVNELYVGIGINTGKVDESINSFATSIEEIIGEKVDRNILIANILNYFNDIYDECFKLNKKKDILEEYQSYQFIIGMNVNVDLHGDVFDATVKYINDQAELVVEVDGKEVTLNSGTIILKEIL